MKCSDMDELISAYTNDELSDTQREFVEEHLSYCPHCRQNLAACEKVKQSLVSLRDFRTPVNLTETTMARIKSSTAKNHSQNWLRPALAITAIMTVVAALIGIELWGVGSPEGTGAMMPPPLSSYIRGYTYTLALLAGVLMMASLAFRSRFARKIAGFMSIVFGGIGVYLGLDALLAVTKSDQSLIMGIFPVFGLIAGIVSIKRQAGRRWKAAAGLTLCLAALVLYVIFLVSYHHWYTWVFIAATVALPTGIIIWSFYHEIKRLSWQRLRPVATAATIVAIIAILLAVQPWGIESPEAMAASIVRNSPEVQAALNDEEIAEVEVTTKVVDDEGNVLMMLVRTEERAVAAKVNLETKKVTDIVRVNVPDFQPGDEQKAIDIARADPRVQELLAQGGVIGEVHLGHSIDIEQVTGPDGVTRKEGAVKPVATVFIDLKGKVWHATVDLNDEKLLGLAKPSVGTFIARMSHLIFSIVTPFVVAFGVLIILGLALRNRLAGKIAGVTSMVFGITGLYGGLYAFPGGRGEQFLALGIPVLGLVMGIAEIKRRANRRWIAIAGVVLCSLALALDTISIIAYPDRHIRVIITIALVIIGIIAYAFYNKIRKIPRKWLRPALVAGAAIIVLALAIIQPWSVSPQGVMARAYSATEGLLSYRMTGYVVAITEEDKTETFYETEYAASDRYYVKIVTGGNLQELIIIGDNRYNREPVELVIGDNKYSQEPEGANVKTAMTVILSRSIPSKEQTLETIDSLTHLVVLPVESLDGTECLHYQGIIEMESMLKEQKAGLDPSDPHYEDMLKALEQLPEMEREVELWIGKDDYIIRQMRQDITSPEGVLSATIKYHDFNTPIAIEPPLDAGGKLLGGWRLVNIYPSGRAALLASSVTSTIGGEDPAHQQISYHITITNRDEEVAGDVRVKVLARATNDASGSIMIEAEPSTPAPVDLGPGESETYNVSWEYDASHTSKEELAKLVSYSRVFIRCTTVEGIEDVQVRSTDVVYPLKNPPTQELVAQYEQARQQADFPINVPTNLPRRLELSHVQTQGMPDGSQMLILTYGDPGAEHIKLSQRKFDVRMTEDEREHQRVFEEAGFSRFTIMNISGYWKEGVLCRTDINDKSTEYWDMSKTQMFWDEGDMTYHLTARDIPIEELMVFAASMIKID